MAEEDNQAEEQEQTSSGKKKWIIIGGVAGLLVIVIVIAVWFMSGDQQTVQASQSNSVETPASQSSEQPAQVGSALYVGMPRPFVFIVPGDARERTVQISVQLMVRGEQSEELTKRHIPLIEGTLHEVFSSSTADELRTAEGKQRIRQLALQQVRAALESVTGQGLVEKVLFTGLVMQ
ncbi:flagellar FliL protein [Idiomarina fontislapidosi]|uniref:Flagellar protein FliL n=1 Tax=Idiomarina fontislapidosi TaxID=263723 RepID=A0A432XRQ8_9GAMM|nr:flagellar basal body-associated protein FliL [Idiomarina fontislapidosi]PYE31021.1 flagellar FliL protein [Idiomarina fontislapidosi]RUO51281.1 flagellar basal body-associated protein FliL [Idiomarina fontislapidosi]|tara:strand:- start:6288 stop:6821 length:534 start_codon:yes stop_codon:yes gene_type:complete